jgi:hypothetical protein
LESLCELADQCIRHALLSEVRNDVDFQSTNQGEIEVFFLFLLLKREGLRG